jgi:hypothetical protein
MYWTVVTLATAMVVGILASFSLTPSLSQEQPAEIQSIEYVSGPDAFLERGGASAVIVQLSPDRIELGRGESATVTVNLSHRAATDEFSELHLVPSNNQGYLGLPSSDKLTTIEERAELARQGKPIPGMINNSDMISFATQEVSVAAGNDQSVQMTVTVPEDLPDEMVGKSIHIAPNFEIREMQKASPDDASRAVLFPDMLTVIVVN